MGYRGTSNEIIVGQSGLNHNPNYIQVPRASFIWPTRNIDLHNGRAETRGGTAKINTTPISGEPRVMGIADYSTNSGDRFQVFGTSDGKVWKNTTTTIKTGMSTSNKFSFETFDAAGVNTLFICDGASRPQTWNGSAGSTSDLTNIPTDWTGSNYPQQMIRHQQGFAMVMVALGFSSTKKNVYISADDDANDFSDANVRLLYCDTGDGYGPIAGVEWGQRFFVFGKERAFYLNDASADSNDWYFVPAQFKGGVANFRLLVPTDNDLFAMASDGTIYSVASAQTYGDYKLASITRPAYIDKWIRDYVNLSRIDDFHAVYDRTKRVIMWFVCRKDKTEVTTAIKYYLDRDPIDAWMIDDQENYDSGYNASCSALIRVSEGDYRIYTGDYGGYLWKLGEPTASDDGNSYYSGFKFASNDMGIPNLEKDFSRIWAVGRPEGDYTIPFNWWLDGERRTSGEIDFINRGAKFGTARFGTARFAGSEFSERTTDLGDTGRRIELEIYNNTAGRKFAISSVRLDSKALGNSVQGEN